VTAMSQRAQPATAPSQTAPQVTPRSIAPGRGHREHQDAESRARAGG
jgi:hypothetical protein